MIGFVGAVLEAWSEVRVHKARVLLSLIGVGVAVAALTTVVAGGSIATQAMTESLERSSGRPATIYLSAYNDSTGQQATQQQLDPLFQAAVERYQIEYATRFVYGQANVQFVDGVGTMSVQAVDVPYGPMHRVRLTQGQWFTDYDSTRLAPAVIVSEEVWNRLGAPDLATHPTLQLLGSEGPVTAVVIGTTPAQSPDGSYLSAFMLTDDYAAVSPALDPGQSYNEYRMWVPPELADELTSRLSSDLSGALGDGWRVNLQRQDYLAWNTEDPLLLPKLAVSGVAVLVLLLGALGLVNIALVTVRQRVREIGIRRSFGATSGRVFVAVMLESVVATVVAGAAGVVLSVLLVKNPITESFVKPVLQDMPAFPFEAALIGLGAATLVGALAGLLPALVAVRVKVIDAIRY